MDHSTFSLQSPYLGLGSIPLVFVEVTPLEIVPKVGVPPVPNRSPCVSAPCLKLLLRRKTLRSTVSKVGSTQILIDRGQTSATVESSGLVHGPLSFPEEESSELRWACLENSDRIVPVVFLPSENPSVIDPAPCWIVGYGFQSPFTTETRVEAVVSDSTLVRVCPTTLATIGSDPQKLTSVPVELPFSSSAQDWKCLQTGESRQPLMSDEMIDEVFHNHDEETIRALSLRMSMLLTQTISIGTTADALILRHMRQRRQRAMQSALDSYTRSKDTTGIACVTQPADPSSKTAGSKVPLFLQEGALIVHSPNHGAGKTLLVRAIAQEQLKCQAIHVIQPTSLLAQYGIHADAALESLLHSIVISAACQQKSICIILDHLDAMVPPPRPIRTGGGDAAMPVLKAIASYLKGLTLAMKRNHELLFPTKNPLYNIAGSGGHVLNTHICLVGIITCADGVGGAKGSEQSENLSTALDALVAGRYRLPALSAKYRLLAFQKAFHRANVSLSSEALDRLPILAASAVEARGRAFSEVARCLAKLSATKYEASLQDLKVALSILQRGVSSSSNVEFTENESTAEDADLFASVGGNVEAKHALEEALAIDPVKRRTLRAFGLSPPTGLLLYGPPGTGKTLLAKSVAKLLKRQTGNASSVGGSFITLQASEIVRGEVGNSEKMIVSAFETAHSNAPSVVFIDEFQALFTERSASGSGKLSSTLLQCMDDVCRWRDTDDEMNASSDEVEGSRVVVMGATNTPWMIDKAFLRPGRFDRVVHVGLPTLEERVSILGVHVARMRLASAETDRVERICQTLAEACDGFSGADLAALCRAAAVKCLATQGENGRIEDRHFYEARGGFSPSCGGDLVTRLAKWNP